MSKFRQAVKAEKLRRLLDVREATIKLPIDGWAKLNYLLSWFETEQENPEHNRLWYDSRAIVQEFRRQLFGQIYKS